MTPEPVLPFIRKKGCQLHCLNLPMLLALCKKGNIEEKGESQRLEGLTSLDTAQGNSKCNARVLTSSSFSEKHGSQCTLYRNTGGFQGPVECFLETWIFQHIRPYLFLYSKVSFLDLPKLRHQFNNHCPKPT